MNRVRLPLPTLLRLALAAALTAVGLTTPFAAPAQAVTAVPFACPQKFYQVSATNTGAFFEYNAASNTMTRVGTGAVSGINGAGYNTADNFIYAVSGTKLYRIDATGSYDAGTTITGTFNAASGGDFYGGKLVTAPTNSGNWSAIDTTTAVSTAIPMTTAANGFASAGAWGAYDLTVQGDLAYGLNNQTLYIVKMDTHQVSTRTLSGPTTGAYGAAYSDSSGNAFFYNNTDNKVFMVTAAELAKATGSATQPTAVLVGGAASTPALTAPNDGASCPTAVSPYVPEVDDTQTTASSVTDTTAVLSGLATANNTTATLSFCFGTDPTLASCSTVGATPGTITGSTPTAFSAELSELAPGTTYYYRAVASNVVGTNDGPVHSFTTTGGGSSELLSQTITFAEPADMTLGDADQALSATATSGGTVVLTSLTPGVCTVVDGAVHAVSAGQCSLAADQGGDEAYDAAPQVTRTITIAAAPADQSQTIDFTVRGQAFTDAVITLTTSASSELPVTVAVVSGDCDVTDGQVTASGETVCVLRATQGGGGQWLAATPVDRTVTFADPADDTFTVDGASVTGPRPLLDVLDNDPAGLTLVSVAAAAHGTASVSNGEVSYVPAAGYRGADAVTYTVSDGTDTATAIAHITVRNAAPVVSDLDVRQLAGSTAKVAVNATDVNGDALVVTAQADTRGVTVKVTGTRLEVTAGPEVSGKVTVRLQVTDGAGGTATATLRDVVTPNPVKTATRTLTSGGTTISWSKAPTTGARYRVVLDGKTVCTTDALRCTVRRILGPDFAVKVEVLGKDQTVSTRTPVRAVASKNEVLIATVYFASGEDTLTKAQTKRLDKVIAKIHDLGFHTAHLAGYTDSDGGAAFNMALSHRRSQNIAKVLDRRGDIGSVQTWFGLTKPVGDNNTAKGKAANRRVEILVRY